MLYQHAAAERAAVVAAAVSERLSARPVSRSRRRRCHAISEGAASAPSVPSEMARRRHDKP
jgi:hypothetical protein